MDLLYLLLFGVLGIVLDVAFGDQGERSKLRKKSSRSSKLLDLLLIVAVLLGVVLCINRFPLGLAGLIAGAILGCLILDNPTSST